MLPEAKTRRRVIPILAWLDLKHEWILTTCMVLAIAAVLSPLLLLLGLKYGTIQTLRQRLIEDPVNREISPNLTLSLDEAWFKTMAGRPDVAFILPTILRGSSILRMSKNAGEEGDIFDLIPTADGDPLILENKGVVPSEGQCAVSYAAGETLGLKAGDRVWATITRTRDGRREKATADLTVTSVLSPRADGLPRVYAPLSFVVDVESFREGYAVDSRGWPGGHPAPYLSFTDVYVVKADPPLSSLDQRQLTINTGIAAAEAVSPDQFLKDAGFRPPDGSTAYRLSTKGNTIQSCNIVNLRNKLRGKDAILLPWSPQEIILSLTGDETAVRVVGLSVTDAEADRLGIAHLPWGGMTDDLAPSRIARILLPESVPSDTPAAIPAAAATQDGFVRFSLRNAGKSFIQTAVVPAELTGILETGRDRRIASDPQTGDFILARSGYRGFRLYARSIDDVPGLYRHFIDSGIAVNTQVQDIERIKIMDRGLTRIFWLVAVVGIAGGIASLVASLYAAVERKKRDISVLRLMGIPRGEVFWFPVYQGVTMACMGVAGAIGGYLILSAVINLVFSEDLAIGEHLCTLPPIYFVWAVLMTSLTAALSALLAAWKTTRIDPAEAIREE